jgi:hypothetical protein
MATTRSKPAQHLNSMAAIMHSLSIPAITAGITAVAKQGLNATGNLVASAAKDNVRNLITKASGLANVGAFVDSGMPWLSVALKTFSNLNPQQQALVGLTAVIGFGSQIYSMTQFGDERHIEAAGYSSTMGSSVLKFSQALATKFATDNDNKVGRALLGDESATETGLDSRDRSYRAF